MYIYIHVAVFYILLFTHIFKPPSPSLEGSVQAPTSAASRLEVDCPRASRRSIYTTIYKGSIGFRV